MAAHGVPLFPDDVKSRMISQILLDPQIPRRNPTTPAWQVPPHPLAAVQSEKLGQFTDFAIIGSGVTGCSVAKTLLESPESGNRNVTIFEARTLSSGATSRNAGFLMSHIPKYFAEFVEGSGKEEAITLARFCDRTVQKMVDLITAQGPGAESTVQMRNVECILAYNETSLMENEIASFKVYQESFPEERDLYSILDRESIEKVHHLKQCAGAISMPGIVFWPYRLITGVFESLLKSYHKRCKIETNTPVTSITYCPQTDTQYPYLLKTNRGDVRASHVFHCSNAFAGHLLPRLRGKIFPTRHTNSCQKSGPQFPNVGSQRCWLFPRRPGYDAASGLYEGPLYYMQQNAKTGDLFFGGERQPFEEFVSADDGEVSSISKTNISTLLPKLFTQGWNDASNVATISPEVQCVWSGIIGSTPDHSPLVGRVPLSVAERGGEGGGEWIAAGFNGYGMVQCWSSGEAIAQMALGQPQPDWLPAAVVISEERLSDEIRMGTETAVHSLLL
ncbi:uncharacterized protein Z520_05932 [Fonsecaea multimorphosa CBS 102226]|uniref:FAD dependent oxidoreductase domain-containing protein n=1 Tax=Fonsecaea multimorphosa CBS 102226 TaxID=1442371 RepID=A0A0D2INM6_9EURO|nr:uncharacterized protein Z520_05932 [Fonsecaea multimorphosa CBS 102226]KIX98631.1 hypothetical protein Z520_05932 [Fonsecaea multimorphosa CBS 102226]OAL24820.1 hypothetical protein AYO22_05609 [Fonsecaea multimorphosa]